MLDNVDTYKNLNQFLEQSFKRFADKAAFSCLGQTFTFADIEQRATRLAAYLQAQGLQPGDRIVIQLPNLIQYPISAYAALKAGLVIVNTNPLYTSREMLHQFTNSGAKAIIILADLMPHLDAIKADTDIDQVVVTEAADLLTGNTSTEHNAVAFNQAIAEGQQATLTPSSAAVDDNAVLQYTGGTTGVAKGAQLSHRNLIANTLQTRDALGDKCLEGQETFICPLPLYHIYAFTLNILLYAVTGNHSVLIPNPRDLPAFVSALKDVPFTGFAGLNTLFVGLCNQPDFADLDFSHLKVTLSGGTALTSTAANTWRDITGCSICEGYGLSETSPVLTLNRPGQEQIGTVGLPLADTEIQCWNDQDEPVADGEAGQLVCKGPQVMKGYWNMPDETTKALTPEGFFKTGDIAVRQTDGKIKIVDRLKDMIIVSGFNVYPNEVEEILVQHPAILEAAVIGEADDSTGERVHAYVTSQADTDAENIIAFCREQLTAYKVPKQVTLVDELPKSPVGKVLRRKLKK